MIDWFYRNPFIFVGYENDRFFSHTNPYISKSMLRNNDDVRQCLYFELGLYLCTHCTQIILWKMFCFQRLSQYSNLFTFSGLKWNKLFLDFALLASRRLSLRQVSQPVSRELLGWDNLFIPRHFQRLITGKRDPESYREERLK